jgi:16S rRNA (cytosine967-C5)-methyltransferase
LVAPAPGELLLDACAGVGGKTTHLAELAPGARVDAVEPLAAKLTLLTAAAARLGLTGISTHHGPLASVPAGRTYDRVVVDAPCTGAGVLRRHPEAARRLTAADVTALAAVQAELLTLAAARVRPGGVLVYAVCTITAEEGPAQLARFLARQPAFALDAPALPAPLVCRRRAAHLAASPPRRRVLRRPPAPGLIARGSRRRAPPRRDPL